VFSPDSQFVAYPALQGGDSVVVVEGIEFGPYSSLWGNSRLAFDTASTLHFVANREYDLFRVEIKIETPR
jgi:hypothetical protein